MFKTCRKCKLEQPRDDFHNDRKAADGKSLRCKSCATKRAEKWYYANRHSIDKSKNWSRHLTKYWPKSTPKKALELYQQLCVKQNLVCKVCQKPETTKDTRSGLTRQLSVDHCHKTGKVRGLLCNRCNRCVGQLEDSALLAKNIVRYLKESNV